MKPAESTAKTETTAIAGTTAAAATTDPTTRCPRPFDAAVFPSMARDRDWGRATDLDLLDLANAAVRRLEAIAHLMGEATARCAASPSARGAVGTAELLDDVATALRSVVAELEKRQGRSG